MDFVTWSDDFSSAVDGWFSELAVKPGDYDRYMRQMDEAEKDFEDYMNVDDLRGVIAFYDLKVFRERYGSDYPSKFAYRNAFSMSGELSDLDQDTVFMAVHENFSSKVDNWKGILRYDTIHELAHQVFFREGNFELNTEAWKKMIFEGHAMYLAEKVSQENGYSVQYPFLELPDVEPENVKEELEKDIGGREENREDLSQLFSYGGRSFQDAEGYPIAYNVAKYLVDQGLEIEEFTGLSDEEIREKVFEAVEELL